MKMIATSREQAWEMANKIFPTDYEKDESSSQRAGYDIYRHRELNYYTRICDLGNRLEVLTGEYGECVTNIWIEPPRTHEMTLHVIMKANYTVVLERVVNIETDWEDHITITYNGWDGEERKSGFNISLIHSIVPLAK